MTLLISREIMRAPGYLLMAISENSAPVDRRLRCARTMRSYYGRALRIAETTEGSTPSNRKAGRKQSISGNTLRTPTARALI
jgi:hypothetical protein